MQVKIKGHIFIHKFFLIAKKKSSRIVFYYFKFKLNGNISSCYLNNYKNIN